MITEEEAPRTERSVTAAPSLVCDLTWLLHVAARPSMQARYPQLAEMFDGREDLADRVRAFWGDAAQENCFTELQVLAHLGGALHTTDPDTLWDTVERTAPVAPLDLVMPSESPVEIEVIVDRMARLQGSPALLRQYLELLQEVWAPVHETWQQALPLIEEAGRHMVTQYERGHPLDTLITPGCDILRDRIPLLMAGVEAGRPLLFVPCLFFGSSMYLEFPDLYVVGIGAGQGDAAARARTESVAKRLKAVADPTRLALLHSLAASPSSVGELAALFRLAQPTVSMHVKVLRQNGLVRSERVGGRLRLSADPEAVESLLDDMRDAVLHGTVPGSPGPTGSVGAAEPIGPDEPAGPPRSVGPVEPVAPVAPVGPVAPVAPVAPVGSA
jgi:DNA-binding transcriptional ArsR family regulator